MNETRQKDVEATSFTHIITVLRLNDRYRTRTRTSFVPGLVPLRVSGLLHL